MEKIPNDKIKENIIFNEFQIHNIINNKEIIKCLECNEIPIIDIISKNNNILIICPRHQNTCTYSKFLMNCTFKSPICFKPENINKLNNRYNCHNYNKNEIININNKCKNHQKIIYYFCIQCREYLCFDCILNHNNHKFIQLNQLLLTKNNEEFIENNIKNKEIILNNFINYVKSIPNENKYKNKGNQLLILLEEKKKELYIEKLILMNYKVYKYNYFVYINIHKLLNFEKKVNYLNINISQLYNNKDINNILNYIRAYLQNGYKQITKIENKITIKNFKDNENIFHIHNKNIKSICALNESLIVSGSWDCFLKIYNIFINQIIYSIEQPSMVFNLKKYPLITQKAANETNFHGLLVCLYCELHILKLHEKNSEILGHEIICKIKGFANFIWTAIVLEPDKKIISASLDSRLSAHKLLPNDTNTNEDINYCLLQSNLNKEKETITSLLQIDENNFVSSSCLDLTDDPAIKFWFFDKMDDKFILEKAIYDIYCCQYPNTICKINKDIIGFALEYANLRGNIGGIALVNLKYKEIISIIDMFQISCLSYIRENRFFTCGYDRRLKKRFIKEYEFKNKLNEVGSLELYHYDDIINIEIMNDSDLTVISSDEGKITVFDNYSINGSK